MKNKDKKLVGKRILSALDAYKNLEAELARSLAPETGVPGNVSTPVLPPGAIEVGMEILKGGLVVLESGLKTVKVGLDVIVEKEEAGAGGDQE